MRLLFFGYLLLIMTGAFGQQTSYLVFDANFLTQKEQQRLINGILDLNGRFYSIRQGQVQTVIPVGTYEGLVKVQIPGQEELWESQIPHLEVTENDTTFLKITLPDRLLPHVHQVAFVKDTGTYYPLIVKDTLNCRDEKGQKQGLWFKQWNNLGNCVDELFTLYELYTNDTLRYSLEFHYDYNRCVAGDHELQLQRYQTTNQQIDLAIICSITRVVSVEAVPGVSSGFDHNQVSHQEMKEVLAQFIQQASAFQDVPFFRDKDLHGTMEINSGGSKELISF